VRSIYLDHNATTPVRPEAARAIAVCLAGDAGNPSSVHRFGRVAAELRERAREEVADAAGCAPRRVVFTSGGTEADNLALRGILAGGGHLVTAGTEHEAVLHTAGALERDGTPVTVLPVGADGRVAPEDVERALRPDTALVSLMAANNETGALLDLEAVGALCRRRGVLFHTDAVQALGKIPFPFDDLPVDLASVSSHKIGGPRGVGALLVAEGVKLRPLLTGGGQERRIRPGTENLPGIVGFGVAARRAAEDLPAEGSRLGALRDRLEAGLRRAFPDARINAGEAARLPNTSNVTFGGVDGASLLIALDLEGIAVSTGAACTAGAAEPSHVLLAMGRAPEEAAGSIRFSLGSGSTEADVEEVLRVLPEIVRRVASGAVSLTAEGSPSRGEHR
jgi:cysteine desulfurase